MYADTGSYGQLQSQHLLPGVFDLKRINYDTGKNYIKAQC